MLPLTSDNDFLIVTCPPLSLINPEVMSNRTTALTTRPHGACVSPSPNQVFPLFKPKACSYTRKMGWSVYFASSCKVPWHITYLLSLPFTTTCPFTWCIGASDQVRHVEPLELGCGLEFLVTRWKSQTIKQKVLTVLILGISGRDVE
jgi:hypothetical protein